MNTIFHVDQRSLEEQAAKAQAICLAAERKSALVLFLGTPLSPNSLSKVRKRNSNRSGMLSALWSEFIDLPRGDQLTALEGARYKGMAWQSLIQCNPFSCVM